MEKKGILIVDDDKEDREEIKDLLLKNGYKVLTSKNGAEALDVVSECACDLILIDIQMPTLSGYDLMRILKEKVENKISLAYITIVPKSQVDISEVDGFIQKPFSSESLLKEVKRILE